MGEPALQLVQTEEVETKALSIADVAKAVKVTDTDTYTAAGTLWKQIGDMIKEVKDTFDPICDAANRAHKEATSKRAKYLDPLQGAYKSVKSLMSDYDAEQDRIRKAEQDRLDRIAREEEEKRRQEELARLEVERKDEEARLLAAAEAAEASGDKEQAEQLVEAAVQITDETKQEAAAILSAPVQPPPTILPKTTPKLAGGPVYRTVWSAMVTDLKALCLAIGTGKASMELAIGLDRNKDTGIITSPALNKMAGPAMTIPGCQAVSRRV